MASPFEPYSSLLPVSEHSLDYFVNLSQNEELSEVQTLHEATQPSSLVWLRLSIILLISVFLAKLISVQVLEGQFYLRLAVGNRLERREIQAPRGLLYDRFNQPLLANRPRYSLELTPAELPKSKPERQAIYELIGQKLGRNVTELTDLIDSKGLGSLDPIVLARDLEHQVALKYKLDFANYLGIRIVETPRRDYLTYSSLAPIIGYTGEVTADELKRNTDWLGLAEVGKSGLERYYDRYLQGTNGYEELEVNPAGQIERQLATVSPQPGNRLVLNLDLALQQAVREALAKGAANHRKKRAAAVILDPRSGAVRALVSLPDYDASIFTDSQLQAARQAILTDPDLPLFNRAIAGAYPPGSTTKPIWAAAALAEGTIQPNLRLITPPKIELGQSVFPDWKPHGSADVRQAIAESNNIFFYAIGGGYERIKGLGPNRLKSYAEKFGWGALTGIDLPGEVKGLVPDPDWKRRVKKEPWYTGDSYHMAIGQGDMLLTPLQIVNSIAAIANNGQLYQPQLLDRVETASGELVEELNPRILNNSVSTSAILQVIREGMRQTVTSGTARPLNDLGMTVAGKTGTAQFNDPDKTHAWFTGFAPYENPEIALIVMVEGGGESFEVAVPIAKDILSWYDTNRRKEPRLHP